MDATEDRAKSFQYLQRPAPPRCWLCRAENPGATDMLGGARIYVCAAGKGCKDGRIWHGPQGKSHYPDQDCPICGPGGNPRPRDTGQAVRMRQNHRNRRRPY